MSADRRSQTAATADAQLLMSLCIERQTDLSRPSALALKGRKTIFLNCNPHAIIDIADDGMIGPNVSIIKTGHPLPPSRRRNATIGKPIVIERNVWIAAGATIVGGVTVGGNSVVAAGSVVTKEVPPN